MHAFLTSFQAYLQAGSPLAYVAAFLGGILVSFTPCTYPILPVTVGYLGSRGGGTRRRTILLSGAYAVGMALTYAALGMAAGLTGQVFGEVTAHPLSYLAMANVCLVLALSMFDLVRLPLPAFLSRAGSAGGAGGGTAGALLVGICSGVIVGPCTAPVLGGLLLYVGASGNPLFGASLFFTFALGMGLPVVALGASAGLLAALPKSGAWMTRVQRAFGVLLLLAGEYLLLEAGRRLV
ncbi:MAG: sulfite exporter TauE/SafE family protein [Deltaproteobacteria bacterium]|nr:sulfite exporter TauE/SafE family protein [Deltaproteobacteria bacterium]